MEDENTTSDMQPILTGDEMVQSLRDIISGVDAVNDSIGRWRSSTHSDEMVQQDPLPPPPLLPPPYTESTPKLPTVASRGTQTMECSEVARNTETKPKKDWFSRITGRMNKKRHDRTAQEPEENPTAKRWDSDYRSEAYPRLNQLVRSTVDPKYLLRGILEYILLLTFDAEDRMYEMPTDQIQTFDFVGILVTQTDYDPGKFFRWRAVEVTDDICNLVRYLENQVSNNRWFNVHREYKDLLVYFVVKPAEELKIQADYALEILGSFRREKLIKRSRELFSIFIHL